MQFHVLMSNRGFPVLFYEEERDGRQYWVRRPVLGLSTVIQHINGTRERAAHHSWEHSYSFDMPPGAADRFTRDHRQLDLEELDRVNRATLPDADHYWISKSLGGRFR